MDKEEEREPTTLKKSVTVKFGSNFNTYCVIALYLLFTVLTHQPSVASEVATLAVNIGVRIDYLNNENLQWCASFPECGTWPGPWDSCGKQLFPNGTIECETQQACHRAIVTDLEDFVDALSNYTTWWEVVQSYARDYDHLAEARNWVSTFRKEVEERRCDGPEERVRNENSGFKSNKMMAGRFERLVRYVEMNGPKIWTTRLTTWK